MARVIIVLLRKPNRTNPEEMRTDPFWEFGSFGCTGCHGKNLLNAKKIDELEGSRLAFVQGGPCGMRLVLLTPPIMVVQHKLRCEAKWRPTRPFKFDEAPVIVDNDGKTEFPSLLREFGDCDRTTLMGRFASAFRSRRQPLPARVANALVRRWETLRKRAARSDFIRTYEQALPFAPPMVDHDRERSYRRAVQEANGQRAASRCGRASRARKTGRRGGTRTARR